MFSLPTDFVWRPVLHTFSSVRAASTALERELCAFMSLPLVASLRIGNSFFTLFLLSLDRISNMSTFSSIFFFLLNNMGKEIWHYICVTVFYLKIKTKILSWLYAFLTSCCGLVEIMPVKTAFSFFFPPLDHFHGSTGGSLYGDVDRKLMMWLW